MGTLSINCPLCCDEHFSSLQLLRDHILEVLNNLHCPACGAGVNSIVELADHIEVECGKTALNIKEEVQEQSESEREQPDEAIVLESEQTEITENVSEDTIEQDQNSDVVEGTNDGVTYMCVMCNIHFKSIEEHLEKYHDGEEVVLETEEAENETEEEVYEDNQITEYIQEEEEEEHIEVSQENANNENEYIEDRNIVKRKSDPTLSKYKANIAPRTENYTVENGKVRKITEEEAAEILDRNSIIQIHQCPRCCLQFPKLDHYVKHNCLPNKSGKKFRCVHCAAVFQTYQSLNNHLKVHVNNQPEGAPNKVITLTPHTCDICNTMFPSFKSLRLHKKMHEPVKVKAVESPVTQNEAEPEAERQMFVCKICNNTYDVEYEEVHMKSHSEEENFFCTTCNRQFATKENLNMHMKAHNNAKKFICSYCKKAFTMYSALHEHVSSQCQNRHYECQYCGRRFSRPHEKVKHERIHTGEKPHICQICGKAFRVSYCLTLHMRTHSGSRPYECPHCNKRFKSHSVYNHHLLIHSNVRAYKCPYCPKAFKTAVQLAGHKNSHIKPFSCTECNRPFASLYAVRAHMETHKRENNLKFDCWLCGATYARAFALKDHMKSQHAGENDNEEVLVDMETEEGDENNFSTTVEVPATEIDEAV